MPDPLDDEPAAAATTAPIAELLGEVLGVPAESVAPDSRLVDDLGVDSLAMLEVAIGVEQRFDVRADDVAAAGLATVGELVEYVESRLQTT